METSLDKLDINPDPYNPSSEVSDYISKLRNKFETTKTAREKKYHILNNRSPEEYWRDSEERWNSIIPSMRKKEWQSAVVKPITRNKCIGIIANLLNRMIEPDITAERRGELSELVAKGVKDLVDHSQELDRYELKMLLALVDAVSKGTAYLQEDYIVDEREIKEILTWDPITNEKTFDKKTIIDFNGFLSSIVSPYEIYLGNWFEYDMQKQPYFFRRQTMPYASAEQRFGKFMNWEFVVPNSITSDDNAMEKWYSERFFQRDLEGDEVEVITYQSKFDDEVAILVNGVLLTSLGEPIPYTHKDYNIVKVVFEPIAPNFALGKSLPDKLMGEQDVIDTLYRMIIDKTFLSIFPPLLSRGNELLTSDIIVPGKVTPIDTEGELQVPQGVASGVGNELNLLTMIEQSMDASSIDPQHLGTPATGERSATQVNAATRGAQTILGLFGFMIAFAVEDWLDLRIQNILQFWTAQERIVEEDGERFRIKNTFQFKNKDLSDSSIGTREIEFAPPELMPSSEEIFKEQFSLKKKGINYEKIVLNPELIRHYKFLVKVKANPSDRMSPELKKALSLEFYDRFLNNPTVDIEKTTRETMKDMDKNPADYMKSKQEIQSANEPQPGEEEATMPGTQNKGNITSQLSAMAQPKLKELITT